MRLITELKERLRALVHRAREDRELEEELRFHLEMEVEENLGRGLSPAEARRQAVLRLGGVTQVAEATRDARGVRLLDLLAQDLRYALRGIRRNPLFAASLVATLGLGIGASAAMFSVVDALLLRPLPYGQPERLVEVHAVDRETGRESRMVGLDFAQEWGRRAELFAAAFQHARATVLYTGGVEPVTLSAVVVSPGFEETLRVPPLLGRGFEDADARPGAEPVVLLSHAFWQSTYGGDAAALGRAIELDGIRHRVIGVMPAGFKFPEYGTADVYLPLRDDGTVLAIARPYVYLLGRLRGEEPLAAAQARADALAAALEEEMPRGRGWAARLAPLGETRGGTGEIRRSVWFLAAGVALILLVAVLNGANLLLVRGWSRTRELAVRVALGASRRRLVTQLLAESTLLALASGAAAVVIALGLLRLVQGSMPEDITFWAPHAIAVEQRTLLFTFAAAAAAGLFVGLVPALAATRVAAAAAQPGALTPYAARTPARSRLRRGLVVAEVALSVTLLVGAGLMINSFVRLVRVDPGFRLDDVAILTLFLSPATYPDGGARMAFLRRLEERIEVIPGVVGATTGGEPLPTAGFTDGSGLENEDGPARVDGVIIPYASVSPDFFELLDVRIHAGRAFKPADAGTDNVVVDIDLARHLWGDTNPIGRRFRPSRGWPWLTVVGVIGDLRIFGPDERQGDFAYLLPASNSAREYASVAVRTAGDPRVLFPAIRAAVHEQDPRQPVVELDTARRLYGEAVELPRFILVLMSVLSGLALVLAAVGVYGVLAYGVAQRRFDLAVRIALGARPISISCGVLGEGLVLAGVGAAVGVAVALALSGLVRSLLYGVEPGDPLTIGAVVLVSLGAAVIASWWPARRATRIDPVEVLKAI